jgi:hypothetical protein
MCKCDTIRLKQYVGGSKEPITQVIDTTPSCRVASAAEPGSQPRCNLQKQWCLSHVAFFILNSNTNSCALAARLEASGCRNGVMLHASCFTWWAVCQCTSALTDGLMIFTNCCDGRVTVVDIYALCPSFTCLILHCTKVCDTAFAAFDKNNQKLNSQHVFFLFDQNKMQVVHLCISVCVCVCVCWCVK